MSFKIEVRADHRAYPVVICDHCNQAISRAVEGNAVWLEDTRSARRAGETYDVKHTHKTCNWAFEHREPEPEGFRWMANGLDHSLFMTLLNCGYKPKKAKRTAAGMAAL